LPLALTLPAIADFAMMLIRRRLSPPPFLHDYAFIISPLPLTLSAAFSPMPAPCFSCVLFVFLLALRRDYAMQPPQPHHADAG